MTHIIAEIGVNHMGQVGLAMDMIRKSAEARAWGVKFQLYVPQLLEADRARQKQLASWMLTKRELMRCRSVADKFNLAFGASCFDNPSVELLRSLKPDFQKVACGQRWPGMKWIPGVKRFESFTRDDNPGRVVGAMPTGDVALLCVPRYPCSWTDYMPVPQWADGISDHTGQVETAALIRGVKGVGYAEVHVANDPNAPDHSVSIGIGELAKYVRFSNERTHYRPVKRTKVILPHPIKGQLVAYLRGV